MRIGIDLDGVLFNFVSAFTQTTMTVLGIKLPPYDREYFPTRWNWSLQYLDEDQNNIIWTHIMNSNNFWSKIPPFEWTKSSINALFNTNKHDVYFITCRMTNNSYLTSVKTQSELALKKLGVKFPTVLVVKEYDAKYFLVRGLNLDVFVDDRTETLNLLQKDCPNTRVVGLIQPWNTDFDGERIMSLPLFISSL